MNADERTMRVERMLDRRVQNTFPSREEAVRRLAGTDALAVYWGIDPTGAEVHIGHSVPLLVMRELAELGHTVTLLIGDFTARIGDPTGKSSTRIALSAEEVQANSATYLDQVSKIIPKGQFSVAYNSEWLSSLPLEQVLKLTSMVTVQQMIQRDMFQERLRADQPIHLNEFLYPLLHGYDSVALRTDIEVGGNDQTFNMLVGRDLEKTILQKDKLVLATHLLVDVVTGKKMSKTDGAFIALSDSPQEMRRKVLALDDSMTETVFRLCTDKDEGWIRGHADDPRGFKEALAAELIRMYHGSEAVGQADQPTSIAFTGPLVDVLVSAGVAGTMSVAKQLISQGAVEVNGGVVKEWKSEVKSGDEIRAGKGKFLRVQ